MFQSVFSIMITPEGIDYCTENNVKAFNWDQTLELLQLTPINDSIFIYGP